MMDKFMTFPLLQHDTVQGLKAPSGVARRLASWVWPCDKPNSRHWVVCVHGLTRQARDFDVLAQALRPHARVISIDVAGRGHSDWLQDASGYHVGTYVADIAQLLMQWRTAHPEALIDWVGTSMGGLIGMALAAQPAFAPRRLVLNDVGPVLEWTSLKRIGDYVGKNPSFDTEDQAVAYLASISASFGPHTPEQWRALSRPMLRQRADGRFGLHYDPKIAHPFEAMAQAATEEAARQAISAGEAAMWAMFDAIECPTLLLRGADSDLLSRATAQAMGQRGPRARCVEFAGVGHAPTLVAPDQVQAVCDFLLAP
jgi:pimeloyl-ACP methyl ester carboxylesterase